MVDPYSCPDSILLMNLVLKNTIKRPTGATVGQEVFNQ